MFFFNLYYLASVAGFLNLSPPLRVESGFCSMIKCLIKNSLLLPTSVLWQANGSLECARLVKFPKALRKNTRKFTFEFLPAARYAATCGAGD